MPIKKKATPKPQYREKAPLPGAASEVDAAQTADADFPHAKPLEPHHFELRDDGTIWKTDDRIASENHVTHAKNQGAGPQAIPSPGGDLSRLGDGEKNLAEPKVAEQPSERARASQRQGEGETHERNPRSEAATLQAPNLIFQNKSPLLYLYHGDCFQLLDAIAAKYKEGRFDAIFADPPYFLSNGGITCHAGKMVKVHKGDWDKSRGPELNHEFNQEWLRRCQRVLKPNGTIWVSGTHHVIFSIGYAMQQLGFKILNDIAWEKPNPPPNLGCRCFTHSTETILWAARDEKSKHVFNYDAMRAVTGKQMKTVWRDLKEPDDQILNSVDCNTPEKAGNHGSHAVPSPGGEGKGEGGRETDHLLSSTLYPPSSPGNIWTLSAPGSDEKIHGKHPTQKPIALIERCILASTNPGDLVLDPFLGGGTTAIAALKLNRGCVGIEADFTHITLAIRRTDREIISIWLRHYCVSISVSIFATAKPIANPERIPALSPALAAQRPTPGKRAQKPINPERVSSNPATSQIDLDLFRNSINGSCVDEKPQSQMPTERIFHETKFVFLSCAEVERGSVVHTTVDVSLQEAWAKTPNGKKRETTHIVRCETEILRLDKAQSR